MSNRGGSRFRLIEEQGYRERELFEGDDLEEIVEFLEMKTGGRDRDDDDEEFFPEVRL